MSLPVRQKVLAYLVRFSEGVPEVAVFDHVDAPAAGTQVPAGTLEEGESLEAACLREVAEESGVTSARVLRFVGRTITRTEPDGNCIGGTCSSCPRPTISRTRGRTPSLDPGKTAACTSGTSGCLPRKLWRG